MKYPFKEMQVGDVLEVLEEKKWAARVALHTFKKKYGGKFKTRSIKDPVGNPAGIEIERTE